MTGVLETEGAKGLLELNRLLMWETGDLGPGTKLSGSDTNAGAGGARSTSDSGKSGLRT